ncbi:MAG: 16S rRNA (cytidine(1402)-2'-O)-methyltransferase [Burkholderiales bacterium]|jgi:16S rRNA (cytidine1402-2'-O)-methyltransferase|nr:16S rRNA (cytidine(1402)-2'-O)-methyltransferase [Burkholderiales bacterium]
MASQLSPHLIALLESLSEEITLQRFPAGALYVVATPIGNLSDISIRALSVLELVDAVACEDTRTTGQLMKRYGLSKPMIATHQHNEAEAAQKIIERLQRGERVAIVSDAGTPAISDPGTRVVDAVMSAGLSVIPIAGPSAVAAAISASGLLGEGFHFVGFLPSKDAQRDSALQVLSNSPAVLVFYEAPHRVLDTVNAMRHVFGEQRRIVIARELSKLFEQIHRCALSDAPTWLAADTNRQRGEFVLLIEGAKRSDGESDSLLEARRLLTILLQECSVSQAAALAAKITGVKKNALYTMALDITNQQS